MSDKIVTGPSSFVAEPMRYGRLLLAGDAAHIVPPTGAKGLKLAVSDVFYLSRALTQTYKTVSLFGLLFRRGIAPRVGAARMSWWLTMLLHRFPDEVPFEQQMRQNQFDYLVASEHAQASLAEQNAGLPFEA
jgi:p-hydroxybenzoate 3-monooxygenase